ncbi:MAG: hypothetical protein WCV69_04180 [Patescibacteria group bacterium]|jgi:hypothetical protein
MITAGIDIFRPKDSTTTAQWITRTTAVKTDNAIYTVAGCNKMPEISLYQVALRSGNKVISAFSHHEQTPGKQVSVTKIEYRQSSTNLALSWAGSTYFVND